MSILAVIFVSPEVFAYSKPSFTNNNGVNISNSVNDNLVLMGFNEEEILNLTQEKYNEFASMDVKFIVNQSQYIESIYIEDETGIITNIENNYITEQEAYEGIVAEEQRDEQLQINNINFDYNKINNDQMVINATNSTTGKSEYTSRTTEYKYMTVNATYYSSSTTQGEFYVRTTLKWLKTPKKRFEDIISIAFADNVQMTSEYISGNQYPKFDATFTYREEYRYSYISILGNDINSETRYHSKSIKGNNVNDYRYNIDEGASIKFQLPKDTNSYTSGSGWSRSLNINHYDFYMTLEGRFIPKQQGINATSFAGIFEHQTGSGSIDWGNVSISPAPPYFSYSTSFWINDPNFDEVLAAPIFFENLLSNGTGGGGSGGGGGTGGGGGGKGPIFEIVTYSYENGRIVSTKKEKE